jgi:protein-arginine deiminase
MGFSSLQDLLDDPVMELSARIDQKHMQPLLAVIRQEFGLENEDIILVPALWMLDVDAALALIPNMVNLAVFNQHLLISDPFFRTPDDGVSQEEDLNANWQLDPGEDLDGDGLLTTHRDPLIEYLRARLPAGLTPHFLDNWKDYHLAGGEVHCASNILRTPRDDLFWWELE